MRAEAATLLGKLHDPEKAMPLLIPKLKDNDPQVRKNAALSLMKLQATNSKGALQAAKSSESDHSVEIIFNLAIDQLSGIN